MVIRRNGYHTVSCFIRRNKMVNTALTTDPFDRVKTYSIGFDRMFDRLFDESVVTTTNYPP